MTPPRPGAARPPKGERSAEASAERRSPSAATADPAASLAHKRKPARDAARSSARGPLSRAALLRWVPWLLLALAAGAGAALAAPTSTLAAACVVVLACAAALLGWFFGESRRIALGEEIDHRSSELTRALTELEIAQTEIVRRLSMAVEFRDEDTGAHIERIGRFSTLLAEQIGMDPEFCQRISHAAPLHDVGKVAIPDSILLKPGPLTPQERAIVETHAEEGYRLVRGSSSAILEMAATIALSHQEKWDGTGYPRGLSGEEIPIEGRIVAVADVFDALTSDRVYRKAFPVDEAVKIMLEQRGRHFDPVLLDAFMEVLARSGADARADVRADPAALAESTLETFATALERGDAEMAEGAIATAIEDGMSPSTLHGEVIAPALRRIDELLHVGELGADRRTLAIGITRRVLATLYRYMLAGSDANRERVLVAGIEGDVHPLELQMMHDQLSAAGYRTILDTHVAAGGLGEAIERHGPDAVLLGAAPPGSEQELDFAVRNARASCAVPIVLGGAAAGSAVPRDHEGMRVLERIDQSVQAVEQLLADRVPAASR
jgi:methanogenic corrinoid protein MtbC1